MRTDYAVVVCLVRLLSTNPWKILRTHNAMPKLDGLAYGVVMLLLTLALSGCIVGMVTSIMKLIIGGRNQQSWKSQIIFVIILIVCIVAFPALVTAFVRGINQLL